MLPHLPLAFAEHLQSRTVEHHIDVSAPRQEGQPDAELGRAFGRGREVRHAQTVSHQRQDAAHKTFGLPVGQPQQLTNRQEQFHRRVAVSKRPTSLACAVFVVPVPQCFAAEPKCDRATRDQRLVICANSLPKNKLSSRLQA